MTNLAFCLVGIFPLHVFLFVELYDYLWITPPLILDYNGKNDILLEDLTIEQKNSTVAFIMLHHSYSYSMLKGNRHPTTRRRGCHNDNFNRRNK